MSRIIEKTNRDIAFMRGAFCPRFFIVGWVIQFIFLQVAYINYIKNCALGYKEFSLEMFFCESLGDRHLVIFVGGLFILFYAYIVCDRSKKLGSWTYRMKSETAIRKVQFLLIVFGAIMFWVSEIIVLLFIAKINNVGTGSPTLTCEIIVSLSLNKLMFYIVVGGVELLLYRFTKQLLLSSFINVICLVCNALVSNNQRFCEYIIGKISWIGRVLIINLSDYEFFASYWCIWGLIIIAGLFIDFSYVKGKISRISSVILKKNNYLTAILASVVFGILAMMQNDWSVDDEASMSSMLITILAGYKTVDKYMIIYLFYLLPIWIYTIRVITNEFGFSFVQYGLRLKNDKKWVSYMTKKIMTNVLVYYLVGILILYLVVGIVGRKEYFIFDGNVIKLVTLLVNLVIQTFLLCELGLLAWMLEILSNISAQVILVIHLLFGIWMSEAKISWLPLTQGIFALNSKYQIQALIYQLFQMGLLLFIFEWCIENKKEEIIMIHWRD